MRLKPMLTAWTAIAILFALTGTVSAQVGQPQPLLRLVALPKELVATTLTNNGFVGGVTYDANDVPHATVYQFTGAELKLIYQEREPSRLYDLNEALVGAGVKFVHGNPVGHYVRAGLGLMEPLGATIRRTHPDLDLIPYAINKGGQTIGNIVGSEFPDPTIGPVFRGDEAHWEILGATTWPPNGETPLGMVTDINDDGTASVNLPDGNYWRVCLWYADGTVVSAGRGLIWRMQSSGSLAVGEIDGQATLWAGGRAVSVYGPNSVAFDINAEGGIVGYSADGGFFQIQGDGWAYGYLLEAATTGLPPGHRIVSGNRITDSGTILALIAVPHPAESTSDYYSALLVPR
jgi:hypothetical protein